MGQSAVGVGVQLDGSSPSSRCASRWRPVSARMIGPSVAGQPTCCTARPTQDRTSRAVVRKRKSQTRTVQHRLSRDGGTVQLVWLFPVHTTVRDAGRASRRVLAAKCAAARARDHRGRGARCESWCPRGIVSARRPEEGRDRASACRQIKGAVARQDGERCDERREALSRCCRRFERGWAAPLCSSRTMCCR